MPSLNAITLMGHLGKDPEVRYTRNDKRVTTLSLATTKKWKQGDEWQEQTEWHKIVCWGKTGEIAAELSKGDGVIVRGRLGYNDWEDQEGKKHHDAQITADIVWPLEKGPQRQEREPRRESRPSSRSQQCSPPPPEDEIPF